MQPVPKIDYLTDDELERGMLLSQQGLTMREIATVLGVETKIVTQYGKQLRQAKAAGRALLKAQAYELAKEGKPGLLFKLRKERADKGPKKKIPKEKVKNMTPEQLTDLLTATRK